MATLRVVHISSNHLPYFLYLSSGLCSITSTDTALLADVRCVSLAPAIPWLTTLNGSHACTWDDGTAFVDHEYYADAGSWSFTLRLLYTDADIVHASLRLNF